MKVSRALPTVALLICFLFVPGKAVRFSSGFLLLTEAFSFLYSLALKNGLTARRPVASLRVCKLDRLELEIAVENHSRLPARACAVVDAPGRLSVKAEEGRWMLSIGSGERAVFKYSVCGTERGDYAVGPIKISACDPLGLFPFEKTIDDRCAILVRPARLAQQIAFNSGIPQGRITLRDPRYEDVTLFRSIRDYEGGDEIRRINWKASARFGKLFTNEFQDSLNCPVFVYLSLASEDYPLHARHYVIETQIERAAAIVSVASERGQQCGFASSGNVPGSDKPAFIDAGASRADCILDLLSRIEPSKDWGRDELLFARATGSLPSGCRVFYVGPATASILAQNSARHLKFRVVSEYLYETV